MAPVAKPPLPAARGQTVAGSLVSLPPLAPAAAGPGYVSTLTQAPMPADPLTEFFLVPSRDGVVGEAESGASERSEIAYTDRERVLIFGMGSEEYGLEIMAVREILKAPKLTDVPRAPHGVLGVFSLRGLVIPVLSLTNMLGVSGDPQGGGRDARVLVVGQGEETVGLWVHRVATVVWMPKSAVEPTPAGLTGLKRALVRGLGRLDQRFVILMDVRQLAAQLGISLASVGAVEAA
jgi:purine-binding chemotaxis protein CheW